MMQKCYVYRKIYACNGSYITAGQQDYAERLNQIEQQRENYYQDLGIAPGVPTMKGAYGDPENTGVGYNTIITELGDHSVPANWAQYVVKRDKGETPGPPIIWSDPQNPEDAQPGYGFIADDTNEEETFFYHSDHLGSTSYITDQDGNITQYTAYLPYGELLVDEHSSSEDLPYKFNGKELDEETGLYYYGARYLQPSASVWYGVDPLMEKYPSLSAYNYCAGNPVKFVDSNGCEIKISGVLKEEALQQIQENVKGIITLSMDNNGRISYVINEGKKLKGNAKRIANMIDDKTITINLITTDKNITSTGNLMVGGAFMGNSVASDAEKNISVVANQEINPNVLGSADAHTRTPGKMIMHELTEAYAGAEISKKLGKSANPATKADISNPESIYKKAHQKATPQTPIYQTLYDKNGNITTEVQNASRVEWSVVSRGQSKVIQILK